MYDPTVGRWLSEDPIVFTGGDPNLYRYVGNSPTNATDPSGLVERMTNWHRKEDEENHQRHQREYQLELWRMQERREAREAGKLIDVEVPKSKDGSSGFCFRVEDFTVRNVSIERVGPGNAPGDVQFLMGFVNFKAELEKRLKGKQAYEFKSLPPGYECDLENKQVYDGKRIIIHWRDQKVYPKPGEDWYVTVTGTIELELGKGWIAPGKKK